VILEQWPDPPQLLVEAATRLRALLEQEATKAQGGDPGEP